VIFMSYVQYYLQFTIIVTRQTSYKMIGITSQQNSVTFMVA